MALVNLIDEYFGRFLNSKFASLPSPWPYTRGFAGRNIQLTGLYQDPQVSVRIDPDYKIIIPSQTPSGGKAPINMIQEQNNTNIVINKPVSLSGTRNTWFQTSVTNGLWWPGNNDSVILNGIITNVNPQMAFTMGLRLTRLNNVLNCSKPQEWNETITVELPPLSQSRIGYYVDGPYFVGEIEISLLVSGSVNFSASYRDDAKNVVWKGETVTIVDMFKALQSTSSSNIIDMVSPVEFLSDGVVRYKMKINVDLSIGLNSYATIESQKQSGQQTITTVPGSTGSTTILFA